MDVTLSTVECLASCGTAPVVMINEAYHENIDPQRVDARWSLYADEHEAADDLSGHRDFTHAGRSQRARWLHGTRKKH